MLLGLFAAVIFSINVWSDGIYSAQEGRAAIIARQMIEGGNWLNHNIKGAHNTEKPIMCYWFYAMAGSIFGVNEFSVRLPSILAGLATVLMTCALGARIYGLRTGLFAGYIMASMIGFVNLSRLARIDIVLCAFYTGAMYLLYTGYFEKMKANWHLYMFYLVLALSVMVKGPVSVALVGATVIALVIKERNWKILWELKPVSGLVIGMAINAPWYIYENMRTEGAFFQDFFMNQNISRFTGINMSYRGGRRQSYFYYIPKLFLLALPWSLLAPFALYNYRKKLLKLKPATYYLLIWFLVVFVFFSLAAIKRGDYLLPLFAPMTILLGRYLERFVENGSKLSGKWRICWIILVSVGVVALIGIRCGLLGYFGELIVSDKIKWISYRDGMNMVEISKMMNNYYVWFCAIAAIVFACLYMLCRMLEKGELNKALNGILLILLAYFCVFYIWIDPVQNKYKTVKYFCERARKLVKPDEQVCYYSEWITETVFFMNRDYERQGASSGLVDKDGKIKYKYIITEPDEYEKLPPAMKNSLEKLEETIPNHQYPHVLLKNKSYKEQ